MADNLFNNTERAFALKSNTDLKKSHFIFKMMDKPWLVNFGSKATVLALNLNLHKRLIKSTIFEQFCGGTTEDECMPLVEKMYSKGVSSILDYSVEGKEEEAEFDKVVDKKIQLIKKASTSEALSFEVVKPTGIGRFYIWQKVTEKQPLTSQEQAEWERIQQRVDLISKTAAQYDVALLYDGEESWMQDAADDLIRDMMLRYNKDKAIIYNTVQCYRHDRLEYIKNLYEDATQNNFIVGAKIVRGAYMEKERERAAEMGYQSPICINKKATDAMFNDVMQFILDRLDRIKLCIGTHNEHSTLLAMDILKEKGIPANHNDVWFGQLYGMSDNLTYNLAHKGHNTFKILPFGPIKDVMPYLIRRAQENTSVAGQMGRELLLIKEEMKRRGI
ncbi:carbapenem antibiotics biosynthesis protein CarD [Nonlabens tegetincola]|uniref:Carbapenem antibiotics biosynthesis protein CarD n=1 Tax=Nonlabens tegetincola TaxID=323273 RepID=A0A090Q5S3_9FLAO|nr:proline dehydrogenase family protein [Nonlabens tegetincola]GAK97522.1 carbapenem antibiotics biosynthesis protein CarD [Nonlabens tegetincola]